MSKCHFPQDNFTIILDLPSLANIQLRLIETNPRLPDCSILSLSCLEHPQTTAQLLSEHCEQFDEDSLGLSLRPLAEEEDAASKGNRRKTGCTCKKTNCVKMYCECFAVGKMCTPECACYGCHNHGDHEGLPERVKNRAGGSNRHTSRGCNCKKTNCQKKYCECFNAGLPCTELCNCCDCSNREGESHETPSSCNSLQ
jgi:hypothetical protein